MNLEIGETKENTTVSVSLSQTSPHLAVFGQSGMGKTTLLRRVIRQFPSNWKILVFDTRDGVEEFARVGRAVPIHIRQSTDPLVLKGLLESIIQSSLKREYATLVRVCEGAKTYAAVIERLSERIEDKRTHAVVKDMMVLLRDLLQRLLVEIGHADVSNDVDLAPGLNVMRLNDRSKQFKQLVVRATLPLIYRKYEKLIVVLDEAQDFVPQRYASACKETVGDFIRTGRGKDDYLILAAQSLTDTDKEPLKQVSTYILFGQSTKGEAQETLEYVPHADKLGLTRKSVQTMTTGECIVSTKTSAVLCRVQRPTIRYAGKPKDRIPSEIVGLFHAEGETLVEMDDKERKWYEDRIREREGRILSLAAELEKVVQSQSPGSGDKVASTSPRASSAGGSSGVINRSDRSTGDAHNHLTVEVRVPCMVLEERIVHLNSTSHDTRGRLALLVTDGWFDAKRATNAAIQEFRRRGWGNWGGGAGHMNMTKALREMATLGFLTEERDGWAVVVEAKRRVTRRKVEVEA